MIGYEYINILKEYSEYFDYKKEDFDELLNTDINIMGLMDKRVYKISPLLMQIADYAYGESILNALDARYYNETRQNFDVPICTIIRNCFNYMDELVSNECHHPTVLMFKDLVYGSNSYENIVDNMGCFAVNADPYLKENLISFLSNVDEKIIEYEDGFDGIIYNALSNVKSWKDLLRLFSVYGRSEKERKLLVLDDFQVDSADEFWIKSYDKKKQTVDGYNTDQFYKIMKIIEDKIDDYKYEEDEDLFDTLYGILDDFSEYRAYHYEYVKSIYKEAKIFEKCRKL